MGLLILGYVVCRCPRRQQLTDRVLAMPWNEFRRDRRPPVAWPPSLGLFNNEIHEKHENGSVGLVVFVAERNRRERAQRNAKQPRRRFHSALYAISRGYAPHTENRLVMGPSRR